MKMVLTGPKRLEIKDSQEFGRPEADEMLLRVLCCAVCRTDAKMWAEGHRDLVLPRIPGHEMVVADERHTRYVVWPGECCGKCRHCLTGRTNLCEAMRITGFHRDGGFAERVIVPRASLIPVPENLPTVTACLAEPVGCVLHAAAAGRIRENHRVLIYGGGTMGLLSALVAAEAGARPQVVEKSEDKIKVADAFIGKTDIPCFKEAPEGPFDVVINACSDETAFEQGLSGMAQGGRFVFFSGLPKNRNLDAGRLNAVHYREAILVGAYGLTRENMQQAVFFLEKHQAAVDHLIEAVVPPREAPVLMPRVLAGEVFKYVLDFTGSHITARVAAGDAGPSGGLDPARISPDDYSKTVVDLIQPVGTRLWRAEARKKIDGKTKPLGALGRLEEIAVRMCQIQNTLTPAVNNKHLFVFAGDHGICETGVSAYPAEVTVQMVENFLNGGAAINVLCRHQHVAMKVVDMGVGRELADHPDLIKKKVAPGTKNFAEETAMTNRQMISALAAGMNVFLDTHERQPIDIVALGEMGIGNSTSAAAIIAAVTGLSPARVTGRGTGVDDRGLRHKISVIDKALKRHQPDPASGFDVLTKVGGFEIAGLAGAMLAAASTRTVVMLDGLISTAAGLLAWLINPDIGGYLIAGHRSAEPGQQAALEFMELAPLLDLDMRLGEGTGAALAVNVVEAACRIMTEMASFDETGVSGPDAGK